MSIGTRLVVSRLKVDSGRKPKVKRRGLFLMVSRLDVG